MDDVAGSWAEVGVFEGAEAAGAADDGGDSVLECFEDGHGKGFPFVLRRDDENVDSPEEVSEKSGPG